MKKIAIIIFLFSGVCYSQRLDQLGEAKPVSVSGGLSANSVFYNGLADRETFTYFLNGNVNVNLYGLFNIPISFAYTNQKFTFKDPSYKINRLSLHPSYKWIQTHIGDISMSFSPYTLNGHQFTGFGFDLSPKGSFKISAMYGRLIRDRAYDSESPEIAPSYKRMGYGTKIIFDKTDFDIGLTVFKAKDVLNSLSMPFPDDIGITPKENLVVSIDGDLKIFDRANIRLEYANSALTNDLRHDKIGSNKLLSSLVDNRLSTSYHNAFKADFSYMVGKGSLGVGYERVDPEYQTLGAYYFNNDLENITVKLSQTVFQNKLNIHLNTGLQRDDLDHQKQSNLSRLVASVNMAWQASDELTLNGSYSNFRTHTQIKNQFDYINEVRPYDHLDTLNFTQISQNAHLNINYSLSNQKEIKQNIYINLSYQNTAEDQDDFLTDVNKNDSRFLNSNVAYNLILSEKNLSITGAFNTTYHNISLNNTLTLGPSIGLAKQFFDKKMRATFSSAYNTTSIDSERQGEVMNFRLNGTYRYKDSHNFNLNIIQLFRSTSTQNKINDFTAVLGYNYTFRSRQKARKTATILELEPEKAEVLEKLIKISYKGHQFEGTSSEITKQLATFHQNKAPAYLNEMTQKSLEESLKNIKASEKNETKIYKEHVFTYLKAFDDIAASQKIFKKEITRITRDLTTNILESHNELEKTYTQAAGAFNKITERHESYAVKKRAYEEAKLLFMHHCWILKQLQKPETEILEGLDPFKADMLVDLNTMKVKGAGEEALAAQIKLKLIAHYDALAALYASEADIMIMNIDTYE